MTDTPDTNIASTAAEGPAPFLSLAEVQLKLRRAVEDRNYGLALALIAEQQSLFEQAGRTHPETSDRARVAHELSVWALTLVRLQREQLSRNLEELSARKRVISCYAAAIPFAL